MNHKTFWALAYLTSLHALMIREEDKEVYSPSSKEGGHTEGKPDVDITDIAAKFAYSSLNQYSKASKIID